MENWKTQPWEKIILHEATREKIRGFDILSVGELDDITLKQWMSRPGNGRKSFNEIRREVRRAKKLDELPENWKNTPWKGIINDRRVTRYLNRARLTTLGEVAEYAEGLLRSQRGFGKKRLALLKAYLPAYLAGGLTNQSCPQTEPIPKIQPTRQDGGQDHKPALPKPPVEPTQPKDAWEETPWENIPWENVIRDTRTYNLLTNVGVRTLGEIAAIPFKEWRKHYGVGYKTIYHLEKALRPFGGTLAPDPEKINALRVNPPGTAWKSIRWETIIQNARVDKYLRKTGRSTMGEVAELDPQEIIKTKNLGKRSLDIIIAAKWAAAISTGEATGDDKATHWMVSPWGNFVTNKGASKELVDFLEESQLTTLGEVAAAGDAWAAEPSRKIRKEIRRLLSDAGAYAIKANTLPNNPNRCDLHLFENLTEEDAWARCFDFTKLNPNEIGALLRDSTLEAAAAKMAETGNRLTRERVRQLNKSARKKLMRNPATQAAIRRHVQLNETKWRERLVGSSAQNTQAARDALSPWERAAIRCEYEHIHNWLHNVAKIGITGEKTRETKEQIKQAVLSSGHTAIPIETAAQLSGLDKKEIQRVRKEPCGYVGINKIGSRAHLALLLTEPWHDQVLVHRNEIQNRFPSMKFREIELMSRGGVCWMAGDWVVIPPRHPAKDQNPEIPELKTSQVEADIEQYVTEVLKQRPAWITSDATQAIYNSPYRRGVRQITRLRGVWRPAPGTISIHPEIPEETLREIRMRMLTLRHLGNYVSAKESGAKLTHYMLWDAEMEYQWATWLEKIDIPLRSTLPKNRAGFARIAQPETWPTTAAEKARLANVLENWKTEEENGRSLKNNHKKVPEADMASIAALILKTGGLSLADANLLLSRCNHGHLQLADECARRGWTVRQPRISWQPMAENGEELLLVAIQREAKLRWRLGIQKRKQQCND